MVLCGNIQYNANQTMSMYGLAETPRPPLPLGSTKIISAMPDTQLSIKQND